MVYTSIDTSTLAFVSKPQKFCCMATGGLNGAGSSLSQYSMSQIERYSFQVSVCLAIPYLGTADKSYVQIRSIFGLRIHSFFYFRFRFPPDISFSLHYNGYNLLVTAYKQFIYQQNFYHKMGTVISSQQQLIGHSPQRLNHLFYNISGTYFVLVL